MFRTLLTSACFLAAGAISTPVYAGTYVNKDIGFTIELAGGLQFQEEEEGVLYFVSGSSPGMVIVKNFPGLTMEDVRGAMAEGYQEEGVYLTPVGKAVVLAVKQGEGQAVLDALGIRRSSVKRSHWPICFNDILCSALSSCT